MTTRAIKGFDANLQCRGYQFEVGKTYKHDGKVKACESGFHVITGHPFEVFRYYSPGGSRFCVVEIDGATDSDDGHKTAAEILTVSREIGLPDLATEAVKWVMDRAKPEGPVAVMGNGLATASGTQGAAMTTGWRGSVKGAVGNALFAVERDDEYAIASVACGIVGQDGIEADTWYRCVGGKLVRA